MPNTKSAKKAVRVTARRTVINRNRRNRIRTFVKKALEAITNTDDENARKAAVVKAESELARGAQKGLMHRNTAKRRISRLIARMKNIKEQKL